MGLFSYLLEASVCMALCYALYLLVFKRLTFFSINRFYLLLIVSASLIIPALHIKISEPLPVQHISQTVIPAFNGNFEPENLLPAARQAFYVNWLQIAIIIYGIVCMAMLMKLFYSIFKIIKQAKLNGVMIGDNRIVHHSANNASFFHIIFLRANNANQIEMEQVLLHEKTHARLLHSADNLYLETVKAFFWFNPFIYLIANALKAVHEYEVDSCLKMVFNPKKYASLLVKLLARPTISITNQFSAYSLKARVSMLFKPHSAAYKKWYYLLILPLLALTGYWFSIEKVYGERLLKKSFVLVLDAGHGGSQLGAQGAGGYYEKDLNLQIVNQIKLVAEERGIKTKLTRTDDSYLDLPDRIKNDGDAFISIHLNSLHTSNKHTNGMEINVDKNSLYPFSMKLAASVKTALQQLNEINIKSDTNISQTTSINRLYVLSHNKAPAILVELGYMTDERDLNYVLNKRNQHEIAEKIIDAVVTYRNGN